MKKELKECSKWKKCNAPVCPLDLESIKYCERLPEENHCELWSNRKWRNSLPKETQTLYRNAKI